MCTSLIIWLQIENTEMCKLLLGKNVNVTLNSIFHESWNLVQLRRKEPRTVDADELEDLSLLLVEHEDVSVEKAEAGEGQNEDRQVDPDQLEDAAVPDQHHLPEPLAGLLGVLVPVGEDVGCVFRHLEFYFLLFIDTQSNLVHKS